MKCKYIFAFLVLKCSLLINVAYAMYDEAVKAEEEQPVVTFNFVKLHDSIFKRLKSSVLHGDGLRNQNALLKIYNKNLSKKEWTLVDLVGLANAYTNFFFQQKWPYEGYDHPDYDHFRYHVYVSFKSHLSHKSKVFEDFEYCIKQMMVDDHYFD